MPAVTVSDITVLPRISAGTNLRARTIKSITTAPQGYEGEGFPVRRASSSGASAPKQWTDEVGQGW